MKNLISILIIFVSSHALAVEPVVGETISVPRNAWVYAEAKVANGNVVFEKGQSCALDRSGGIEVISVQGDNLKVKYLVRRGSYGSMCPNGTKFTVTNAFFNLQPDPLPTIPGYER